MKHGRQANKETVEQTNEYAKPTTSEKKTNSSMRQPCDFRAGTMRRLQQLRIPKNASKGWKNQLNMRKS
jgi:hypothetical protein